MAGGVINPGRRKETAVDRARRFSDELRQSSSEKAEQGSRSHHDPLPVEHLVEFLIFHLEGDIMRPNRLRLEEPRQSVMLSGKTGAGIEISFRLEDLFAQRHHIVAGEVQTIERVDHVDQRLEGFGLVQNGKSNEEAHTGCINRSGCHLQIARQLDLAFRL